MGLLLKISYGYTIKTLNKTNVCKQVKLLVSSNKTKTFINIKIPILTIKWRFKMSLRVEKGLTRLIVPHNGQDLTFIHPKEGPGTYAKVAQEIDNANLARPTMAQTASLVHAAVNSNNQYSQEVLNTLRQNWMWGFTGTLFVPNKGAYIQDNPEIENRMPVMDQSELIKKLEASDPNVRFVPFGFETGEMTPRQLEKNKYVIGLAGEEGAEKLAEVADRSKRKPYLWSFESVNEHLTRVSALDSDWGFDGRLNVNGGSHGYVSYGFAFGVQKTGEASPAKK